MIDLKQNNNEHINRMSILKFKTINYTKLEIMLV